MADITKEVNDKNRIIYMHGEFNENKAKEIVNSLLTLESQDPTKDIIMYIDSYGGYVHSLLAIHDVMRLCRCDIATICIGKAMSCGQMLLMSGTKGKRFVTPNARVLLHEISTGTFGTLKDVEIDIIEAKKLQKILESLVLKYSKIKKNEIRGIFDRDHFFSAEETVKFGLADHVLTTSKALYKIVNV